MKSALIRFLIICSLLYALPSGAQNLPEHVVQSLQKVHVPAEAVGAYVQEISTQPVEPLINWRTDALMQPASTMKLVTSYAALDLLGPSYTWKTSAYMNGHMNGDVLVGDLILQGGGDPHLVLENFWSLLHQLRDKGLRTIQGNLIIDQSWMAAQQFDAADFDGDPTRPYNVGPDALLINFNVLELQLHADPNGLRVTSSTPLPLQTNVHVQYVGGACGEWRTQLTPVFSLVDHQVQLTLNGTYPISCGDRSWLLQPYPLTSLDYNGALFRGLWTELGGQFQGEVQAGVLPPSAELIATLQSPPLSDILRDMNKFSNNVMTRLVLLTLDKEASKFPANSQRASQLVQLWFARLGIAAEGMQLENGSGLSRNERISALQMGQMLQHAFASRVMPELMSSMPVLGLDGTMKNRAASLPVAGHAHIKSGGLEGVRNFAGYVLAASGRRYVVICFVNHKNAKLTETAQDELLQWVYDHG